MWRLRQRLANKVTTPSASPPRPRPTLVTIFSVNFLKNCLAVAVACDDALRVDLLLCMDPRRPSVSSLHTWAYSGRSRFFRNSWSSSCTPAGTHDTHTHTHTHTHEHTQ